MGKIMKTFSFSSSIEVLKYNEIEAETKEQAQKLAEKQALEDWEEMADSLDGTNWGIVEKEHSNDLVVDLEEYPTRKD